MKLIQTNFELLTLVVRVKEYQIPVADWSHIDFMISMELDKYTNRIALDMLNRHYDDERLVFSDAPKRPLPVHNHSTCKVKSKCERARDARQS
jgi:hypothetical protein